MSASLSAVSRTTTASLRAAVHRSAIFSRAGLLERMFTAAFAGLVYPQIWEDPVIDMEALAIRPGDHIVAIASGGCNVMSYLTADPERITAVDLNGAHIALNRLKLAAAQNLPDHSTFRRFFGGADSEDNVAAYDRWIKPHLDAVSRAYWEGRSLTGRRRIEQFGRNFYRYGLLGSFIGAAHLLARAHGKDLRKMLDARSLEEQRAVFDSEISPLFRARAVRWLIRHPASLYGLGIPPAQYHALAANAEDGIIGVLHERLRRLACDFDLSSNYFAQQAFGRAYGAGQQSATPPYLESNAFHLIRERAERVETRHMSMGEYLASRPASSLDGYVLLDAQDWMDDDGLTDLWTQITRTARPGARVIFRTAANERLLPGRITDDLLDRWAHDEARCLDLGSRDRSSIYGAFHLYTLKAQ